MSLSGNFMEDINLKYSQIEKCIEENLAEIKKRELAVNESDNEVAVKAKHDVDKPQFPTAVEARQRNSALIKSLEKAKARLRSRATYSPLESILYKAQHNYPYPKHKQ